LLSDIGDIVAEVIRGVRLECSAGKRGRHAALYATAATTGNHAPDGLSILILLSDPPILTG
jgi:hypothetical protein